MSQLRKYAVVTEEEEISLCEKAQQGDLYAREQLILSCMPLVIYVAGFYKDRGLDLEDLISEGVIGLLKATENFEARGVRFSTYAGKCVRGVILHALAYKASIVRIPEWRGIYRAVSTVSLDEPLSENSRETLGDRLRDRIPVDEPDVSPLNLELREKMRQLLASEFLPCRENYVLTAYFGIDRERQSAREIAAELGVKSAASVYHLLNRGVVKLRRRLEVLTS